MKKLTVIIIAFIIGLIFYLNLNPKRNDILPKITELKEPIKRKKDTPHLVAKKPVNYESEPVASKYVDFNQYLSTRPEFDLLLGENDPLQVFINSSDVTEESSFKFIDKILEDVEGEQLSVRQLFLRCNKLKDEPKKYSEGESLMYPNDVLIHSIYKKGLCHMVGSNKDPFYMYLELARKGDMLSQLLLIDDLGFAIKSGAINLKLYPMDYEELRQEAKQYLENLSANGVKKASDRLVYLYKDQRFFPEDKVKQYFYAYLAEKQNGFEYMVEPWNSSEHYYEVLSDEEKLRADRMVRSIK
ncbi:hypothetical protein [Marinicella rhabdoformis]|uniref:hypothetical protein n=1 Tax=Marinicella rhabdoformis TaxID=2580566 RepID=UPI0012AEB54C|nr:hypothetical protein [Marinicella rhabdoformis]